jgi:hypothetical protein
MRYRSIRSFSYLLVTVLLAACPPNAGLVRTDAVVPDRPPVISIGSIVDKQRTRDFYHHDATDADPLNAVSSGALTAATVSVQWGSIILIEGSAANPDGVSEFAIEADSFGPYEPPNAWVKYTKVETSGAPDAQGLVPSVLRILGGDGSQTSTSPVAHAGARPVAIVLGCDPMSLVASAKNFHGDQAQLKLTYQPAQLPNPSGSISANPPSIAPGGKSTLSWSTQQASGVDINGATVQASGSMVVSPQATTHYEMTLYGPCLGSPKKTISTTVMVGNQPPPQPQPTSMSGGFQFDTLQGAAFDVTVKVSGQVITPVANALGSSTFSTSVTQTITPDGFPATIPFQATGLKSGVWKVSASSTSTGGTVTCQANAPGHVTLSLAGGNGPQCLP